MHVMETILAIAIAIAYIIVAQWTISTFIMNLFEVDRTTANWFSYFIVVVLAPSIMYYYFYYTLTPLALIVFGTYSVLFLSKQAYQSLRIVSSKYTFSERSEAPHTGVLSLTHTQKFKINLI